MVDWAILFTAVAVFLFLFVLIAVFMSRSRETEQEQHANLDRQNGEAEAFIEQVRTEGLKPIETGLLLGPDEHGVLEEPSVLYETRAYRVYGGAGTRVGRVLVGGGASESHQRLREIDTGRLTLTTKRLVFDGGRENRTIKLSDLLSVERWSDAIEVSTQRRSKSAVFSVRNPAIWAFMVQGIAKGAVTAQPRRRRRGSTGEPNADAHGVTNVAAVGAGGGELAPSLVSAPAPRAKTVVPGTCGGCGRRVPVRPGDVACGYCGRPIVGA